MTFHLQHLCSIACCWRQLSHALLHHGLLFRCLLLCAQELGGLGRKVRAVRAAGRSWGGSVGESPEMLVTGKARLPYLGASFMEINAQLLCKSFVTQGKAINLRA